MVQRKRWELRVRDDVDRDDEAVFPCLYVREAKGRDVEGFISSCPEEKMEMDRSGIEDECGEGGVL